MVDPPNASTMHCAGCNIQPIERLPDVVRLTVCALSPVDHRRSTAYWPLNKLLHTAEDGESARARPCADPPRPCRRGDRMRRPQTLVLLVALLSLSQNDARAQPKLPTIGFMGQGTASAEGQRAAAFVQRLRELGWIEGQNVAIEFRWAEGRSERSAE